MAYAIVTAIVRLKTQGGWTCPPPPPDLRKFDMAECWAIDLIILRYLGKHESDKQLFMSFMSQGSKGMIAHYFEVFISAFVIQSAPVQSIPIGRRTIYKNGKWITEGSLFWSSKILVSPPSKKDVFACCKRNVCSYSHFAFISLFNLSFSSIFHFIPYEFYIFPLFASLCSSIFSKHQLIFPSLPGRKTGIFR